MAYADDKDEWEEARDNFNSIFAGQAERDWDEEVEGKRGGLF